MKEKHTTEKAKQRNHRITKIEDFKIWSKAYLYIIFKDSWGRFVFWIFHISVKIPTKAIITVLDLTFFWQDKQMESRGNDFLVCFKNQTEVSALQPGKPCRRIKPVTWQVRRYLVLINSYSYIRF